MKRLLTTGVSRWNTRQIALWDQVSHRDASRRARRGRQPRSELLGPLISRWGKSRVRSVVWVPGASMQVEEKYTRKEKGWNEACVEEGPRSAASRGLNIGPF